MKPIKKWRSGNIELAIWNNEREKNGVKIEFKTMSLTRNWKRKEEEIWRSDVINLRRQDIPKIEALLTQAKHELYLSEEQFEEAEDE